MEFKHSIVLQPIQQVAGDVRLPGSKSLSNRILLMAALADGVTHIENLLDSDDVRAMVDAMVALKIPFEENRDLGEISIQGIDGHFPVNQAQLFLGNAGTAMRPLTAALTLGHGKFVLDGVQRMRERPIQDLIDGLTQLGVSLRCLYDNGCPPVEIIADGLPGGEVHLSGAISSQYLSALLMAAPYAKSPLSIHIKDKLVSTPYVDMTLKLMRRFGAEASHVDFKRFEISNQQHYRSPGNIYVEGDASSASYFLAAAAILGGPVTVTGCGKDSIQGDAQFAAVLEKMGANVTWQSQAITVSKGTLNGIDIDMNAMPDAAMTLAVLALFAKGKTAIRNIYNWRVKETERLNAVATELRKLGADVEEGHDFIIIQPPEQILSTAIDTYEDHRMAMAFSLAACGRALITINNPECVTKTFPEYFRYLADISIY